MEYTIKKIAPQTTFPGNFNGGIWAEIPEALIHSIHPASSPHRPDARVKCACDGENIYLFYEVHDRYLNAVHNRWNESVCLDSCVEFFVAPGTETYLNFETNCLGNMLASHVIDWDRSSGGLANCIMMTEEDFGTIRFFPTLQAPVENVVDPVTWRMGIIIPIALIKKYIPQADASSGSVWRGNFFKCGGMKGYEHFISWSPVTEELNFHLPQCFGTLIFE